MWQKEFENNFSLTGMITILCFGLIAGVWIGLDDLLIGGIIILAGVVFAVIIGYTVKDIKIICTPEGFTVYKKTRFGKLQSKSYLWSDVTATRFINESLDSKKKLSLHIYTSEGKAVAFRDSSNFEEFVQLFNHYTPHLPYVWVKHRRVYKQEQRPFIS